MTRGCSYTCCRPQVHSVSPVSFLSPTTVILSHRKACQNALEPGVCTSGAEKSTTRRKKGRDESAGIPSAGELRKLGRHDSAWVGRAARRSKGPPFGKPLNIVILMTDEQRAVQHWPARWAERNLKSLNRLRAHGLNFTAAFTNACQCSPSRATFLTSTYAPINRVTITTGRLILSCPISREFWRLPATTWSIKANGT